MGVDIKTERLIGMDYVIGTILFPFFEKLPISASNYTLLVSAAASHNLAFHLIPLKLILRNL